MTKSNITLLTASLIIALAAIFGPQYLPLEVEEIPIVKHAASETQIVLGPRSSLAQTFTSSGDPISGVYLFSTDASPPSHALEISIQDNQGNILAADALDHHTFKDQAKISNFTFSFPTFTPPLKQELTLVVVNTSSEPFSLIINQDNYYPYGRLLNEGEDIDLAFSLFQPRPLGFPARQGILAGLITLLAAVLVSLIPKGKWVAASLFVVLVTPIALAPIWYSLGDWGISDWDFYFTLHENYRRSLLDYNVFPFWHPYVCGGTAGLGDPEFPIFSVSFLLELIFGVPNGLRLAIYLSVILAGLGMLALARRLGLSVLAGLLAALTLMFSTNHLLTMAEGHVDMFAVGWLPWIFWAWHTAYKRKCYKLQSTNYKLGFRIWPLLTGAFLALTFYQGGIYILFYLVGAFPVLILFARRKRLALKVTLASGLWALGLAALKLIPVLLWMRQFPDAYYSPSTFLLKNLDDIFLGRYLHGTDILVGQLTGWHEYGTYIGPLILAASVLGISQIRQRIVLALVCGVLLTILFASSGLYLVPLFDVMPWLPRSNISRALLFAVLGIGLLAGYGLDALRRKSGSQVIPVLLIGLTAIDLMSLAYPLAQQIFVVPAVEPPVSAAPWPLVFTAEKHTVNADGRNQDRTYASTLAGYGTLTYCTVLGPRHNVIPYAEKNSQFLRVVSPEGTAEIVDWSPTRVLAQINSPEPSSVILNNNYAPGWRYKLNDNSWQVAQSQNKLVLAPVPAGQHEIIFAYRSPGFIPGLTITLGTLVLIPIFILPRHVKKN